MSTDAIILYISISDLVEYISHMVVLRIRLVILNLDIMNLSVVVTGYMWSCLRSMFLNIIV